MAAVENAPGCVVNVKTGAMLSAIVTLVVAEAVDIVPEIPFWPRYANVPALVKVTATLFEPPATLLLTVMVQTVVEV